MALRILNYSFLKTKLIAFARRDFARAYIFQGQVFCPGWRFRLAKWIFRRSDRMRAA